jgi:hypothetical protein
MVASQHLFLSLCNLIPRRHRSAAIHHHYIVISPQIETRITTPDLYHYCRRALIALEASRRRNERNI